MADHDDSAGVIFEVFADDFLGVGVEMVSRLVEDDEIRTLQENFTESDTGLFAGGKDGDFFINVIAIEEEVTEDAAKFGVGEIIILDILKDGTALVENLELLGVVGDSGVLTDDDGAGIGCKFANDKLKESRLTDAVFTNDEEFFAAGEGEREIVVEHGTAFVMEREILDFKRSLAALLRGGDIHSDAGVSLLTSAELFEFLGEDFLALMPHADEGSVAALGGAGAGDKLGEAFYFPFLLGDAGIFGGKVGGVLATEISVIPFVDFHIVGGLVDEKNLIRNSIEEVDVVGDDENHTLVITEEVGDESFCLDIEMVSRLVEEKESGILEEDAGEGDFGLLTARKFFHSAIHEVGKLHFVENF